MTRCSYNSTGLVHSYHATDKATCQQEESKHAQLLSDNDINVTRVSVRSSEKRRKRTAFHTYREADSVLRVQL